MALTALRTAGEVDHSCVSLAPTCRLTLWDSGFCHLPSNGELEYSSVDGLVIGVISVSQHALSKCGSGIPRRPTTCRSWNQPWRRASCRRHGCLRRTAPPTWPTAPSWPTAPWHPLSALSPGWRGWRPWPSTSSAFSPRSSRLPCCPRSVHGESGPLRSSSGFKRFSLVL